MNYISFGPASVLLLLGVLHYLLLAMPVFALISCWRNGTLNIVRKIIWSVLILVTWFVYSVGAILYGAFCFKSKPARIFAALLIPLIMFQTYLGMTQLGSFVNSNMTGKVQPYIDRMPNAQRKAEIQSNFDTLTKEADDTSIAQQQRYVASLLKGYLGILLQDNLSDEEYKEWQSLFYYRSTLTVDHVNTLIKNKTGK